MIVQAPVARLLRLVIERQDMNFLANEGIREDDFQPKTAATAFKWVKNFHQKYNKFPTLDTIKQELDLELPQSVEETEFVLRTFKDYALGKRIQKLIEESASRLEARDVPAALSILKQVEDLKFETNTGHSFRLTAEERYDRYEAGKESTGAGLSTPWPSLTEQVIGYLPSTLTTVIAMSNIGKTWLSVIHACHFMSLGKRVALVTLEDALELVENRLDAYYYKINNKDLNRHQLKIRDDLKWRQGLKANMQGEGDIITYTNQQVQSVSDLEAVVQSAQADVLIVDAAYRLSVPGTEAGWKTSEHVVNALQHMMTKLKIPIILTVQQDPEQVKKKTKHERLYSTRGGKFWGIGSTLVIEITADEDMRLMQVAKLSILKNKNFVHSEVDQNGEIDINWNLLKMNFDELDPSEVIEDITW